MKLTGLGCDNVAGLKMCGFGVLVMFGDHDAETADLTIVVEKADRSKDTFIRENIKVKEQSEIQHVSEIFGTLDLPVTSVLSIDATEKTRDGKRRVHRFR